MSRWKVGLGLGFAALALCALVAAPARAAGEDVGLSLHIPALEGATDVQTSYVRIDWTDGTSNTYLLPANSVTGNGILNAAGDVSPPNKKCKGVYAFGTMIGGGAYSRSATATQVDASHYNLYVGGVYQGQIIILEEPL